MRRRHGLAAAAGLALVAACAPAPGNTFGASAPGMESPAPQSVGQTFVFVCGDRRAGRAVPDGIAAETAGAFSFTLHSGPQGTSLWLPPRFGRPYLVLEQAPVPDGARYAGKDVAVYIEGNQARLEVGDEVFGGCRHDRRRSVWEHAKLAGVDFRAVGQEPGWYLEIRREHSLTFVTDYGQRRVVTPYPEPQVDARAQRTVYRAVTEAHELRVILEAGPCADTMSGKVFETSVTVVLDGQIHRGCGRALH